MKTTIAILSALVLPLASNPLVFLSGNANTGGGGGPPPGFDWTDLVAYYDMEEGSGTTLTDTSPNSWNGTITGASYGTGKVGTFALDHGEADVVVCGDITDADNVAALSVGGWFKLGQLGEFTYFFTKYRDGFDCWAIGKNAFDAAFFSVSNTSGSYQAVSASTAISDANWHHIVGVYNGSNLQLYLDGVAQSGSPPAQTGNVRDRTDEVVVFGSWNGSAVPTFGAGKTGSADELFIFKRALSAAEVTSLYNGGSGMTYP